MKKLLLLALLPLSVNAVEVSVDPNDEPVKALTCQLPVERMDGDALPETEIAAVHFHSGLESTVYTESVIETACRLPVQVSEMPDGVYYYSATVVDTDGRVSPYAEELKLTVKRIAPPREAVWGMQ